MAEVLHWMPAHNYTGWRLAAGYDYIAVGVVFLHAGQWWWYANGTTATDSIFADDQASALQQATLAYLERAIYG